MKRAPVLTAAAVMFAAAASASLTAIPSASAQSWRENMTGQSEGSGTLRERILDELQSRGALQDELANRPERRRALRDLIENRLQGEGGTGYEGYGRGNIDRILDRLERRRMLRELIENRHEGEGGLRGLLSERYGGEGGLGGTGYEGYGRGNIDRILDRLERRQAIRELIENRLQGEGGLRGLLSERAGGEGGLGIEGRGRIRELLAETPERDLRRLIRDHLEERAALLDLISQCVGERGGRLGERISEGGGRFGQSAEDRQAVRELILDRLRSNPDLEQTLNRLRDRIGGQG
ncbi:MAG: hypothetical protein WBX25_10840 [Rhodomicrobium sp.]